MYSTLLTKGSALIFAVLVFLSVIISPVSASTSGGPSCRLFEATQTTIHSGESTVLTWQTLYGTKVVIDHGALDTRNAAKMKIGSVSVSPTKDTTYKLTVSDGSKKDTCTASVRVLPALATSTASAVTAISARDQAELVSTVAVAQIPYTGFDGSAALKYFFFTLLGLWVMAALYVLLIARAPLFGFSFYSSTRGTKGVARGILPHAEYKGKTQDLGMSHMNIAKTYITKERVKYAGVALSVVAVAVFVVLPLMPQVSSSLHTVGLKVGIILAEGEGDATGSDGIGSSDSGGDGTGSGGIGSGDGGGDATGAGIGSTGSGDATGAGGIGGVSGGGNASGSTGSGQGTGGSSADDGDATGPDGIGDFGPGCCGNEPGIGGGGDGPADPRVDPPFDLCPNIDGNQDTLPSGMVIDAGGSCVTPIAPTGTISLAVGACVSPTERAVSISWSSQNAQQITVFGTGGRYGSSATLSPAQTAASGNLSQSLPTGSFGFSVAGFNGTTWATLEGKAIAVDASACAVVPPDLCPNIPGDQATIPAGMIKNAAGNCVVPSSPMTGTITATPGACVSETLRTVTIGWNTQNASYVVSQASGGRYAGGQNLISPTQTGSGSLSVDLPAGGYAFSVSGAQDTSSWTTLRNTSLIIDTASCQGVVPVVPVCDNFTATPATLTAPGNVALTWNTTNADSVSIDNGVGSVSVDGNATRSVTANTTFILTAVKGAVSRTCQAVVTIQPTTTPTLSCDSFTINPTSVERGANATMSWSTTNADSVSIDGGVGTTTVNGSRSFPVDVERTYTLTATRGTETRTCTATALITTHGGGGGGGGGSSPRCVLFEATPGTIASGATTTLHWKTQNGTTVTINNGALGTTSERALVREGTVSVSPTTDTRYTLTVARGSSKRTCTVDVTVGGGITVLSSRDQQLLLTSVPYTGFEAGPMLTSVFYVLLTLWSLSVAYVLVIKGGTVFGFALPRRASVAGTGTLIPHDSHEHTETVSTQNVHAVLPRVADVARVEMHAEAPANLPVAPAIQYGYAAHAAAAASEARVEEAHDFSAALETFAHSHNVLLSSDALRMIVDHAHTEDASMELLGDIVNRAKATYAREDGWVVLNRERVMTLFPSTQATVPAAPHIEAAPVVPVVSGLNTLAEAILTGNTSAAYGFLGNVDALAIIADAAEALDSVVRARVGATTAPDMLMRVADGVSDEKIKAAVLALVSAIDGTYADEIAAVRLSVIKALKAVAK